LFEFGRGDGDLGPIVSEDVSGAGTPPQTTAVDMGATRASKAPSFEPPSSRGEGAKYVDTLVLHWLASTIDRK